VNQGCTLFIHLQHFELRMMRVPLLTLSRLFLAFTTVSHLQQNLGANPLVP
jgi:hypothetical protein